MGATKPKDNTTPQGNYPNKGQTLGTPPPANKERGIAAQRAIPTGKENRMPKRQSRRAGEKGKQ
jgi:hypothetical protein